MPEARDVEACLIDDEDEKHLTKLPRLCIERCCPRVVQWLEAMGYDQALIVKDVVHMCLYLSFMVSFFFAATSISEVMSFHCFESDPGNDGDPITDAGGLQECLLDFVVGLIFFGNLRDSAVMLGSYDDDHATLLNRKKELMAKLKEDIEVAYNKADENANKLYDMLLRMGLGEDLKTIICHASALFEEFNKVFFGKQDQGEDSREGAELLRTLVDWLEKLLAEPRQISLSFCKVKDAGEKVDRTLKTAKESVEVFADMLLERHSGHRRSTDEKREAMKKKVKFEPEVLAQEVIEPVKIVSAHIMDLKTSADQIVRRGEAQVESDKLMGFGRPPWADDPDEPDHDRLFRCCMPRLFALILKRVCCLRCCWPSCLQKALEYYPRTKKVRFGPIWFQIVSKLHERQIQGLIFSVLLAMFYVARVTHTIVNGCKGTLLSGLFWGCAAEEFKKSAILLALLFHIPATFLCLCRIRHLDAIIRIMEDIRKLQGLRNIIRDWETHLEADTRRQEFLDQVQKRISCRAQSFKDFREKCYKHPEKLNYLRQKRLQSHIEAMNYFFKSAQDTLQDADKWLKVPNQKQDELIAKVAELGNELGKNEWKLVNPNPETAEKDGSISPPLTPSNSSMSLPSTHNS